MSDNVSFSPDFVGRTVSEALQKISASENLFDLRAAKSELFGEASTLGLMGSKIGQLPEGEKAEAGKLVGAARKEVVHAFENREAKLIAAEASATLVGETIDLTSLGARRPRGARHPLSLLMEDMADVFVSMGWEVATGPEVEHEWFNFDALNFDADHPARAMQDTFFVEPENRHLLLRTHTSPVQIRSLLSRPLPLYVVAPGRVYRTDELDTTHTPVFHQIEGIAIDTGLTMAHLRGTLEHLAQSMFGVEAKIRLRPNYFPFTEPSAELDIWHPTFVGGARWIEWGGCGMVNPKVLQSAGIDADEFRGFAFGMGIERTLMFRNNVSDMRDMVEGDVRFSSQFGMVV